MFPFSRSKSTKTWREIQRERKKKKERQETNKPFAEIDRISKLLIAYGAKKNNDRYLGIEYDFMGYCLIVVYRPKYSLFQVRVARYQEFPPIYAPIYERWFCSGSFYGEDAEQVFYDTYKFWLLETENDKK